MSLTVAQVVERLRVSRSTVIRALHSGALAGDKFHSCGSKCSEPATCQQGRWEISEQAVEAFCVPVVG
ncbi:helix-turn-helix domain-containing protein [Streptosporangium sp. NPDC087985]|uniref:helix-turn-helix domain-containing protein n=1 Tax=Streptosporangium sp. NPDC087985 TaxID=3366196 RepID=UPI0037F5E9EA